MDTKTTMNPGVSYRGYIICPVGDSFIVGEALKFSSIPAAKEGIDGLFQAFALSMRRPVNITHSFTKEVASYAHA